MLAVGAIGFGERPQPRQLWGALLGLAGVCVVLGRGSLQALLQVRFVAGDLLMVAAAIGWAVYSWLLARPHPLLAGKERPDWDWAAFLLVQTMFGVVWGGAFAVAEAEVEADFEKGGDGAIFGHFESGAAHTGVGFADEFSRLIELGAVVGFFRSIGDQFCNRYVVSEYRPKSWPSQADFKSGVWGQVYD